MPKSKNSAPLLIVALVLTLLLAFYYFLILPKHDEINDLRRVVSSLGETNLSMKSEIELRQADEQKISEDVLVLRNKLPQNRNTVQLIRDIEGFGQVSNSQTKVVSFMNYDGYVSQQQESISMAQTEQQLGLAAETDQQMQSQTLTTDMLPPSLQMLNVNLEIIALSKQGLLTYIKELENLERIMRIEGIELELPGEEQSEINPNKFIRAQIHSSTFYYNEQ